MKFSTSHSSYVIAHCSLLIAYILASFLLGQCYHYWSIYHLHSLTLCHNSLLITPLLPSKLCNCKDCNGYDCQFWFLQVVSPIFTNLYQSSFKIITICINNRSMDQSEYESHWKIPCNTS